MHATPHGIDEGAFKMDAENFRAATIGLVLSGDVVRDSFRAAADRVWACRYGSGKERSGAVSRQRTCHCFESIAGTFHNVVAPGAVNVHIKKTRRSGFIRDDNFPGASR